MGFKIVCARAGKGKSYFCIKDIARCIKEDTGRKGKFIFLVPEQFTVQAERMLLSEPECGGSIIRADVVNFKRMAQRALQAKHMDSTVVIDGPGRKMILYKAVEECRNSLKIYKNALVHFGLIEEILELIDETGKYNFSNEKIEEVVEKLPESLPVRQKLIELAIIREKYENILHKSYVDEKDLMDILADQIINSDIYTGAKVWIDGFFGFTAQEYTIISGLLQRAQEVTITLCCDLPENKESKDADFLHSVYKTYDNLIKIARDNKIGTVAPILLGETDGQDDYAKVRHLTNPALAHFEREYNRYPIKKFKDYTESINIFAAKNIYSEVEYTACKIVELCREEGLRFREIGIIAKNIESYAPACMDIFSAADIPFFIDSKKDLLKHPLAKLVVYSLDILVENFSYKSIFKYLKTGLLTCDQEIVDIMENVVLAKNINSYKKWIEDRLWEASESVEIERIKEERNIIIQPLSEMKKDMSEAKNVQQKAAALYSFLMKIDVKEIIQNRQEAESMDKRQSGEYVKVWNSLLNVLDKMVEALGNERVSIERFTNIFKAGLENYRIGEIPSTIDSVQIGSLGRSINTRIKVLFFLGVNEGVVPGVGVKEGLLTDSERQLLKEYSVELAADSFEQAYLEEFQIYAALAAPSEKLFVSYIVKDAGGKQQRPSRIISRIENMFPGIVLKNDIMTDMMYQESLGSLASTEYAYTKYLYYLGNKAAGQLQNETWEIVGKYFYNDELYKKRIDKARIYSEKKIQDISITEESARKLFGGNIISSVSQIEKYNSCPYSFYLDYGIRARERDIPDFDSREIGTLVHQIIERIGENMDEENIYNTINEVIEENKNKQFLDSKRSEILVKRTGETVKRAVEVIARHIKSSRFKIHGFEVECNMELDIGDGTSAQIAGKIDRIDMYNDGNNTYFRVIDYKTGDRRMDASKLYAGTEIQLFAYLNSWMKYRKNAIPAGAFYSTVQDRFLKINLPKTESEMEFEKRKSYRLSGIVLADVDVLKAMDENIGASSEIIPAGITAKGEPSQKYKGNFATKEEFDRVFNHVENVMINSIQSYKRGVISPQPFRVLGEEETACKYCRYTSICEFDSKCGDKFKTGKKIRQKDLFESL